MRIYFGEGFCGKKRLIKKLFSRTLEITGNDALEVSVNINFVTGDDIHKLNKVHRNVDRVTDVLSFPMLNIARGQNLADFADERLPNGELPLGDIALCKDKIQSQAKEYGHSYKRELAFLIVHGFLHLTTSLKRTNHK